MATTVLERPALEDAAPKRIYRRVALVRASEEAISKQRLAGKLSFSFYQVTGQKLPPALVAECLGEHDLNRGLLALHQKGADAIVQAAQDMIR